MLNICSNMQKYAENMHQYAIVKYEQIRKTKVQNNMQKYGKTCQNMHDFSTLKNMQKYAKNMQEYVRICKICNQGFYMQNMHSPLC